VENLKKTGCGNGVGSHYPGRFWERRLLGEVLVQGKTSFKRLEFPGRDMEQ